MSARTGKKKEAPAVKTYVFHSALPPEEITARLRERTRPWSRPDGWTARNTWFLQERADGALRLILTGRGRSYVFAGLTLLKTADGTDITADVNTAKTYILDVVFAVFLGLGLVCAALLGDIFGGLKFLLQYGWVLPLIIWTGRITRRQAPELIAFIEEDLLE